MNTASSSVPSVTPPVATATVPYARSVFDEDDLALGLECANPALQIEMWGSEAAAQPQQLS